ncbi:unnamed protein product [Schistocephalus solidus]|uniref:EF-hand domain-containing protein n=1 Tax=Schistocephalus solidus TaxID=70667 RepID=A0A183SF96_SCHSO|nr:unnamed protein product [Schistocephalus solidus]
MLPDQLALDADKASATEYEMKYKCSGRDLTDQNSQHKMPSEVQALLASLDADKSGTVSTKEFLTALHGSGIKEADVREFISQHDKDGDGELNVEELMQFLCSK